MAMSASGAATGMRNILVVRMTLVGRLLAHIACAVVAAGEALSVAAMLRSASSIRHRIAATTSASGSRLCKFNDDTFSFLDIEIMSP